MCADTDVVFEKFTYVQILMEISVCPSCFHTVLMSLVIHYYYYYYY